MTQIPVTDKAYGGQVAVSTAWAHQSREMTGQRRRCRAIRKALINSGVMDVPDEMSRCQLDSGGHEDGGRATSTCRWTAAIPATTLSIFAMVARAALHLAWFC
jgi:hypothetical protein